MAVNPLTDSPYHLCDDDEEGFQIKKEIVEEEEKKQGGKRKHHTSVMKDKTNKTSQTNNNNNNKKKLSPSKSKKHGTPRSAGKEKCVSCQLENTPTNGICGPGQVKSPAMNRAKHVRSSLGTELPSFSKLLVRSHVDSNSMSIPASFCRSHLPINDSVIVLEDESEEQFDVKYFPKWMGLSGGWRKFSLQHKLSEGDVLVFQLVAPSKFKVYIIRANGSSEIDGAPSLVNLDTHAEHNELDENLGSDNNEDTPAALKMKKMKSVKSFSQTVIQKKNKKALPESENDSEEVRAEFSEHSNFSKRTNPCKGIETLEDFNIMLNGLCVEYSELHENMRKKYYELCCSKNVILHDGLPPSLNSKLVAGIIGETVNIADAIKACNFATSQDELEQWEKSLKSFELLGMNVGFLLDRLSQLLRLVSETNGARFEDEIKNLEVKRVELKEAYEKIGSDIEKLKSKAERQHLKFRELVNAPCWGKSFLLKQNIRSPGSMVTTSMSKRKSRTTESQVLKSPGENSDKNKGDEEETTPSTLEIKRLRELLGDVEQEMSATLKIKKLRALYGSSTDPSNFLSEATKPSCKELETFEDFHITVEGICIDSNLSEETRKKYYQLCCSQNSLLHDRLTTAFCAAIIIEIVVIIADSIKACDFNLVGKEGDLWEKALKCFQIFGMKVGFLLHRLSQLVRIANDSKRCLNEIEDSETFRSEWLRFNDEIGAQIQRLKSVCVDNKPKFEELVNAPW